MSNLNMVSDFAGYHFLYPKKNQGRNYI